MTKLSAETRRSLTSIVDDARLRDPNDFDIAPDGRIYFTDSTTRYDAHDWALDSIENRATGRLLVYDPRSGETKTLLDDYRYTNGVCMAHDGKSLFFAESWACRVHRYWIEGPKAGTAECVIQRHAGLSRQHQPRLGRQLLDGLARHAHAELRSGAAPSRLSQAHDAPPAAGRVAVPQHQHRRRGEIHRGRRASSRRSAT